MDALPKPQPDDIIDIEGEWEDLVSSIDATDIPIDMLKILRIHHNDGTRYIFPIKEWLDDGVELRNLQSGIDRWYRENGEDIAGSDFIIDLEKLKATVTTETRKTLKDL